VAVADYGGDSGECGNLVGSALGIAARGDDAGLGVLPVGASDVSAGFAISFGSDAAGVDDDHIGFGGKACGSSGGAQESGYCLTVGARGATTEVLDVEGSGHKVSLAELARCAR
jgi:hypothetical protein